MTDDRRVVPLDQSRVRYSDDVRGTLREAGACVDENDVRAVAVVMVDGDGEEFYLISRDVGGAAMVGALEIVKDVVMDELRAEDNR